MKTTLLTIAVVASLLSLVPASFSQQEQKDRITVVYVSAANCPYCRHWDRTEGYRWEKSVLRKEVEYVEVHGSDFNLLPYGLWPKELQWVPETLGIKSGTPRFVVIAQNRIVMHRFGSQAWGKEVLPLIERLVIVKESPPAVR